MRRGRLPTPGPRERRAASLVHAILERVTDPRAADETRIDRWLCAVRLVKTRPLATRLCEGGHVLVNGSPAKPSTKVRAGDRVESRIADRERVVEVVRPIESRVGALVAATCYVDHSPPAVPEAGPEIRPMRGEGRPSKRLRRELERLRRRADA
jgi:ribosome-associated heat shock protein Hsp15